ncbi:MAG TPA: hypothetical protein VGD37_01605 [Kofleriaceae bacterium]
MTRIAGVSVLLTALVAAAGCGVGGDDMMPGGGSGSGSGTAIPPVDEGEVCNAAFTVVNGTFAPGTTPRPIDPDTGLPLTGCWPVGTWTFHATVASNGCATAPTVISTYSFKVERVAPPEGGDDTIQKLTSLTTTPTGMQYHLAVSSNGQGCEAHFELGTADGTQYWNMKPTLPKDPAATTLGGDGYYVQYQANGWPWK